MDTEQVTEVTVHMLDGGAEFAVPVRLGAELTREGWLRVRREEALARGERGLASPRSHWSHDL